MKRCVKLLQEKSLDISSVDDQVEALQKRLAAAETELHETRIKAAKSLRQVNFVPTSLYDSSRKETQAPHWDVSNIRMLEPTSVPNSMEYLLFAQKVVEMISARTTYTFGIHESHLVNGIVS